MFIFTRKTASLESQSLQSNSFILCYRLLLSTICMCIFFPVVLKLSYHRIQINRKRNKTTTTNIFKCCMIKLMDFCRNLPPLSTKCSSFYGTEIFENMAHFYPLLFSVIRFGACFRLFSCCCWLEIQSGNSTKFTNWKQTVFEACTYVHNKPNNFTQVKKIFFW